MVLLRCDSIYAYFMMLVSLDFAHPQLDFSTGLPVGGAHGVEQGRCVVEG
jgi:hypothetical protein